VSGGGPCNGTQKRSDERHDSGGWECRGDKFGQAGFSGEINKHGKNGNKATGPSADDTGGEGAISTTPHLNWLECLHGGRHSMDWLTGVGYRSVSESSRVRRSTFVWTT